MRRPDRLNFRPEQQVVERLMEIRKKKFFIAVSSADIGICSRVLQVPVGQVTEMVVLLW